jgi:hypothetical protein
LLACPPYNNLYTTQRGFRALMVFVAPPGSDCLRICRFFSYTFLLSLAYLPRNGSVSIACAFAMLLGHSRPLFCAVPFTLLHACRVFIWVVTKAFACARCHVLRVLALQPTSSLLRLCPLRTPSPVFVSLLCSWLIVLSSFVLVIVLSYRLPRTAAADQPPPTPGHLWPVTTEVGLLAGPIALKLVSTAQAASPEEARWTRHATSSILMEAVGLLTGPAALKLASTAQAASPEEVRWTRHATSSILSPRSQRL